MEIKINVYSDCTSDKPTKTYTIKRILFKTAKQLSEIQEESKAEGADDEALTLKMLKAIIPDFQDEDIDGIDPIELGTFMKEVGSAINGIVESAQKNL